MKAGLLLTGSGALVYLTSHEDYMDTSLTEKFAAKGITKFIAYEVSEEECRNRYASHFDAVLRDLHESDDLRILDYDGTRAFKMFPFNELNKPFMYEKE